jgi:hypothetical protein
MEKIKFLFLESSKCGRMIPCLRTRLHDSLNALEGATARLNTVHVLHRRFQILRSLHRDADAPPSAVPKPDPVRPPAQIGNSPLHSLRSALKDADSVQSTDSFACLHI